MMFDDAKIDKIPETSKKFRENLYFILNFSIISSNSSSKITLILHP